MTRVSPFRYPVPKSTFKPLHTGVCPRTERPVSCDVPMFDLIIIEKKEKKTPKPPEWIFPDQYGHYAKAANNNGLMN